VEQESATIATVDAATEPPSDATTGDASPGTETATTSAMVGGIAVYQTSPQRLTMHRIEDHELELLINISRPIMLTLAGVFGGGFLGLLPAAILAYQHVNTQSVTASDLTSVLVCGACLVGVVVSGVISALAQRKASATIANIRSRVASPVGR
jgi:hypothetical protein